jgi:hypothetical protein
MYHQCTEDKDQFVTVDRAGAVFTDAMEPATGEPAEAVDRALPRDLASGTHALAVRGGLCRDVVFYAGKSADNATRQRLMGTTYELPGEAHLSRRAAIFEMQRKPDTV